ncbi:hypothetical protein [Caproiciproducens sp.]|uniref:hypothetical protein n=1 Tax=Caproiciproducens sp. TaxID=1954376 RepID=UPI002897E463|nr:hypothetical protein [Caproiciproducens sp.]
MPQNLNDLLKSDPQAQRFFESLPKYAQEAVRRHTEEITTTDGLRLFTETFMQDDSYQGA